MFITASTKWYASAEFGVGVLLVTTDTRINFTITNSKYIISINLHFRDVDGPLRPVARRLPIGPLEFEQTTTVQ